MFTVTVTVLPLYPLINFARPAKSGHEVCWTVGINLSQDRTGPAESIIVRSVCLKIEQSAQVFSTYQASKEKKQNVLQKSQKSFNNNIYDAHQHRERRGICSIYLMCFVPFLF